MNLSAEQRRILGLICDTVTPGDGGDLPSATELGADETLLTLLDRNPDEKGKQAVAAVLRVWNSRAFGLATGFGPRRFDRLSRADRERLLLRLSGSPIPQVRTAIRGLTQAAMAAYYATPGPTGVHPFWTAIGYPTPPGPRSDAPASALTPIRPSGPTELDCDVVIVGSGAGGGTAAAVLAKAGLSVIVVERGEYYDDANFGWSELDGLLHLYAPGPAITAEGQLGLVAGSCLGGGTVVNWTTSLRTPDDVRAEWAALGARQFATDEYTAAMDVVGERIGVTVDRSPLSARDALLERGLQQLGWHVDVLPRNVAPTCDAGVECGRCGSGCRVGAKQSATKTWLADAAEHGATLLVGTDVRTIDIAGGRATGVHAVAAGGCPVHIRARAVVAAAGAIQTPALLRRSGLTDKPIGDYLRLHPATAVQAVFDEEVLGWQGGLQARYSAEHRDLDGAGYGVVYETGPLTPAMTVGFTSWAGAARHRQQMLDLPRTGVVGIITRDRDHGSVGIDSAGNPVVRYRLSERDAGHLRVGVDGAARILEAAGAQRIRTAHQSPAEYIRGGSTSLDGYLAASHKIGYGPGRCSIAALHIMGSARMGGSREMSATNPDGAVWSVPNLVVADGSCFPTASGVNPMLSIEAIGYMNATRL
ncbi:FAD-dependent oxidoreductase, partial [Skermania piniformis]